MIGSFPSKNGGLPTGYVKIAIENGGGNRDFSVKHVDFPWLC